MLFGKQNESSTRYLLRIFNIVQEMYDLSEKISSSLILKISSENILALTIDYIDKFVKFVENLYWCYAKFSH